MVGDPVRTKSYLLVDKSKTSRRQRYHRQKSIHVPYRSHQQGCEQPQAHIILTILVCLVQSEMYKMGNINFAQPPNCKQIGACQSRGRDQSENPFPTFWRYPVVQMKMDLSTRGISTGLYTRPSTKDKEFGESIPAWRIACTADFARTTLQPSGLILLPFEENEKKNIIGSAAK